MLCETVVGTTLVSGLALHSDRNCTWQPSHEHLNIAGIHSYTFSNLRTCSLKHNQ